MLRLMLNSHPRLRVPFEWPFLDLVQAASRYSNLSDPAHLRQLLDGFAEDSFVRRGGLITHKEKILACEIRDCASLVRAIGEVDAAEHGKQRFGIKMSYYASRIDEIRRLFPRARIIHIVRDGRGFAASYRKLSWGSRNVPHVAATWRSDVMAARSRGASIGVDYHELCYEDLVTAPEAQLRRICEFIGEEFHESMLEYYRTAEAEMPADSLQWHRASVSAPDASKVTAWRTELSLSDQLIFEAVAGDALATFGYPLLKRRAPVRLAARRVYYALFRPY